MPVILLRTLATASAPPPRTESNLLWEGAAGPAGTAVQPALEGRDQSAWCRNEARGSELGAGAKEEAEAEAEAAQSPALGEVAG